MKTPLATKPPNITPGIRAAVRVYLALVLMACLVMPAFSHDWPQWRGPDRDGVWHETGIIETNKIIGIITATSMTAT